MSKLNIALFASHGGSNAQAIINACAAGKLDGAVAVVISNQAILETLLRHEVGLIALAGYMKKLGPRTLRTFAGRIVNVHPSLLPKFGGHGMYGLRVHEAVLAAGERETGVTVHLVDAEYDEGSILAQSRVPVLADNTIETLAERVLRREHEFYAETLQRIACGEIVL
ncbi:MAG: Phosphoribosylglycinamide formyltransferase [Paenibacillus sp.]|nr:Phosphoribosylglycinamide formyltransferase [Paenibacillus sp.]